MVEHAQSHLLSRLGGKSSRPPKQAPSDRPITGQDGRGDDGRRPAASTGASSPNTCMATSAIRSSAKLPLATMASGAKRASSGPNTRVSPTMISSNSVTSNTRSSFGRRITGLHRSSIRSPMLLSNWIQRQLGALLQSSALGTIRLRGVPKIWPLSRVKRTYRRHLLLLRRGS